MSRSSWPTAVSGGAGIRELKVIVVDYHSIFPTLHLSKDDRRAVVSLFQQAVEQGHKVVISLLDYDNGLEMMVDMNLRMLFNGNDNIRRIFTHNGQKIFSHADLKLGEVGVLGQRAADLYVDGCGNYWQVPCAQYVRLETPAQLADVRAAIFSTPAPGRTPPHPG